MIYDRLANKDLYGSKGGVLDKALTFAAHFSGEQEDGKYVLEGDQMYAMVLHYETSEAAEGPFESHRKYLDVQIVLEGQEILEVTHREDLSVRSAYDEEKDAALWEPVGARTGVILRPGLFAALYPQDIHRPGRVYRRKERVRKMVVKILL